MLRAGLGPQRAKAMHMALDLPADRKSLKGVGEVPSWLTDENAAVLEKAPCMKGVVLDKACRYCKPTPRPKRATSDADAEAAEPKAGESSEEQGGADGADVG